jgi:hypothetical protein
MPVPRFSLDMPRSITYILGATVDSDLLLTRLSPYTRSGLRIPLKARGTNELIRRAKDMKLSNEGCLMSVTKNLLLCTAIWSNSQNALGEEKLDRVLHQVTESIPGEYHYVQDLVLDTDGAVHLLDLYAPPPMQGQTKLAYVKLDRDGQVVGRNEINLVWPNIMKIGITKKNDAFVFYTNDLSSWTYYLSFDHNGQVQTRVDKAFAGGYPAFCTSPGDSIYVLLQSTILFTYLIEPHGHVEKLAELPPPGVLGERFVCEMLDKDDLLVVWPSINYFPPSTNHTLSFEVTTDSLRYAIVDLRLSHRRQEKRVSLAEVAEAEINNVELHSPKITKSKEDVLVFASMRVKSGGVKTYRVRFNSKGELVKGSRKGKIKRIEASDGLRVPLKLDGVRNETTKKMEGLYLYGFTDEGNIVFSGSRATLNVRPR